MPRRLNVAFKSLGSKSGVIPTSVVRTNVLCHLRALAIWLGLGDPMWKC